MELVPLRLGRARPPLRGQGGGAPRHSRAQVGHGVPTGHQDFLRSLGREGGPTQGDVGDHRRHQGGGLYKLTNSVDPELASAPGDPTLVP
jgi:hypothetical protein